MLVNLFIRNVMRNNLLGDLTNKQEARGKKRGDTTPRLKNPAASESLARKHYNLRQMEKYIKWSVETRGYLKWKDLVEYQSIYKIVE